MSDSGPNGTQRTEEQFLIAIIHDIRRHLRSSAAHVTKIEREASAPLDAGVRTHLNGILEAGRNMDLLLTRVAQYAAVASNPEEQPRGDVCVMFDSALRRLAHRNTDASIDSNPIRGCAVQAPYAIEVVLRELLDNALKFRKGPVKITVLVDAAPDQCAFGIKDDGIGFDQQYSERIMLPLERLHSADTYEGCGMGLAICQKTVQTLGGKLWVESKVNGGSTFWFSVPA